MGKQAPKLVLVALIVAILVILAWQNSTPLLALSFLGFRSVTLPLGVWLVAAIALGSLTTIAILVLTEMGSGAPPRSRRRQWHVQPDMPPHPDAGRSDDGTAQQRNRRWQMRSPQDFLRREGTQRAPNRQDNRNEPRQAPRSRPSGPPPSNAVAAEDWQAWGQRNKPSAWNDWSDASGNRPEDENFDRRQKRDRDQAEATIHDLDKGWDESARETVYVPPGGSEVQDTLDEIEDGWEGWDSPDNPLSDTAYAEKYAGVDRANRRDSIYAPPDDPNQDDDQVYDADYRVIIPPYQPSDDGGNEGDRAS
ncbi:hypothetical protein [Halomicronema sp. CCY15110]|uniref:hypothetical protein n=1 Tax=Halomicronema sp. CCY15110 TaxID=2767773 RepID=UPI0019501A99|nr:hypothetical protein [Halomicronema sp. CCY15110]